MKTGTIVFLVVIIALMFITGLMLVKCLTSKDQDD
jgi:hypothetical protein